MHIIQSFAWDTENCDLLIKKLLSENQYNLPKSTIIIYIPVIQFSQFFQNLPLNIKKNEEAKPSK